MQIQHIPFADVPQLSRRDLAYASQAAELRPFYEYAPTLEGLRAAIDARADYPTDRALLQQVLREQYGCLPAHEAVEAQLEALGRPTTFTLVTAHQPSLFTGPLYYIYKICSTINLARRLNAAYPDVHVVPVFVSGGEDHDFEEINHANLFGKTVRWEQERGGAVGRLPTDTLGPALAELKDILGDSEQATAIYRRIEAAYQGFPAYAQATQALVHDLFGAQGLVVLNMDDASLKRPFASIMRSELLDQPSQAFVERAQQQLESLGFSGQAYAREINLFYFSDGARDRIVREGNTYRVLNTELAFTREAMLAELEAHPERFSPNVILRPLYQETILPNLAYIGGGGELAYWLERREQFAHYGIPYPVLIRRSSVLWIDRGTAGKMDKLDLRVADLFRDTEALIKDYVREQTENELSLTAEKEQLEVLFQSIAGKAREVDPTLEKAVLAEHARQLKAVENLEGRLMRAEKQRHDIAIGQLRALREKLFPGDGLQERHDNFLTLYTRYGDELFTTLIDTLDPLEPGFVVIIDRQPG